MYGGAKKTKKKSKKSGSKRGKLNLDKLATSTLLVSSAVASLSKGQQKTLKKKIKQKRTKMKKEMKKKGKKRIRSGVRPAWAVDYEPLFDLHTGEQNPAAWQATPSPTDDLTYYDDVTGRFFETTQSHVVDGDGTGWEITVDPLNQPTAWYPTIHLDDGTWLVHTTHGWLTTTASDAQEQVEAYNTWVDGIADDFAPAEWYDYAIDSGWAEDLAVGGAVLAALGATAYAVVKK